MPEINFFWDPLSDNILQERDETGAVTAEYTAEPGLYGNLISQNRGGVESQFHYDAQGSTLAVTDDNQNVTDTFAYTAFGEVTERIGTTDVPFQYIGQKGYYTDGVTGQIVARRRPYEPTRGRWLAIDPLWQFISNPTKRSLTLCYGYAQNSPLAHGDPSGEMSISYNEDTLSPNSCGAMYWKVNWTASKCEKGFIAQFMTVTISCNECKPVSGGKCSTCDYSSGFKRTARYTELWFVDDTSGSCKVYGQYCSGFHQESAADYWCFNGCGKATTCGYLTWEGEAFFIPFEKLNQAKYKFGGASYAGCLLSMNEHDEDLRRYAVGNVPRFLSSEWKCCDTSASCCCTTTDVAEYGRKDRRRSYPKKSCRIEGGKYSCPSPGQCRCAGKSPDF
jgi:RHS repeat-associated protein